MGFVKEGISWTPEWVLASVEGMLEEHFFTFTYSVICSYSRLFCNFNQCLPLSLCISCQMCLMILYLFCFNNNCSPATTNSKPFTSSTMWIWSLHTTVGRVKTGMLVLDLMVGVSYVSILASTFCGLYFSVLYGVICHKHLCRYYYHYTIDSTFHNYWEVLDQLCHIMKMNPSS